MSLPYALRLRRLGITAILGALGVAIGAANIIALVSVTESGRYQAMGVLRDAGSDTIFVVPFVPVEGADFSENGTSNTWLPAQYEDWIRQLPQVDGVAAIMMMPGHIGAGASRMFVTVQGVNPDYIPVRGHKVARGRFVTDDDLAKHARVCCLGSKLPQKLFGNTNPLGQQVVIKGQRFTVAGVMVEKGLIGFEDMDQRVFVPLTTAQELYDLKGLHTILARTAAGYTPRQARDAIEAGLRRQLNLRRKDPIDFSVSTVEQLTKIIDHVTRVFRYMLYGIGSVALLVAGIGIMNVMLMQVIERTREIGIRRAVGARRRDILRQFIVEAAVQATLGVLFGIGLGIAGSLLFCRLVGWGLHLASETVPLASLFSLAIGIIFGVYPAIQAAHLKPIDCLRYE